MRNFANRPYRSITIHHGEHDVHQDHVDVALIGEQFSSRVNNDWQRPRLGRILDLFEQFSAGHVGQAEVQHHAIVFLSVNGVQGFFAGSDHSSLDVTVAD